MDLLSYVNKKHSEKVIKSGTKIFSLRNLRISLKYRPEILNLILRMRQNIKRKSALIKRMMHHLKVREKSITTDSSTQIDNIDNFTAKKATTVQTEAKVTKHSSTQTELPDNVEIEDNKEDFSKEASVDVKKDDAITAWSIYDNSTEKSIAEQVKEVAQSALQQSGMVYVESAKMYYDYKTGYYYNSELGLYYHTDTGCYYYYNEEKKEFVFHSYPDRSAVAANASLAAYQKRKAKKHKKDMKTEEDIDSLTKNLSQDKEEASKPKRRKKENKAKKSAKKTGSSDKQNESEIAVKEKTDDDNPEIDTSLLPEEKEEEKVNTDKEKIVKEEMGEDLEDGECSETESEKSEESDDDVSEASTSTASDDDAVAKHHPPCMRIIVRETSLPKLKVGSLFLVTKDGGTIGREGDQHAILIRDHNVSRNHLDIRYDMDKRMYMLTDLGSKNGTQLNGIQMSESQVVSKPMEVMHGSTIQLGETKLLCHIHAGNDTCGHCEPGLIMETQEKEKVAYTRTCSVQKQHQLELARLKNKYVPEPLMIEEGTYNDRAKARRDTIGSTHHSEKTQSTDVDTFIAPENKGFKLLEKMGWSKGEGLGKDCQGDVEPIPLVSNEGKAGLGAPGSTGGPPLVPPPRVRNTLGPATLRLATRSKLLKPPAKAFLDPLEDDSD